MKEFRDSNIFRLEDSDFLSDEETSDALIEKETQILSEDKKTIKVVCSQCNCTIIEYDKDKTFEGVDICSKCFIDYVSELVNNNNGDKINIYED